MDIFGFDYKSSKTNYLKLNLKTIKLIVINSHARDQWFESTSAHHTNQGFQAVDI